MPRAKRLPKVSGEEHAVLQRHLEVAYGHIEALTEQLRHARASLLLRDKAKADRERARRIAGAKAKAKVKTKRSDPAKVRAVKRMREEGEKLDTIARELRLNWRTVRAILDGAAPREPTKHRRPSFDPLENCRLFLDTE